MSQDINKQPQLFILRLWPEILVDDTVEWRGRVHHVQSNEIRYFRDWPALIPTLLTILRQAELPMSLPDLPPPAGQPRGPEPDADAPAP